MANLNAEFHQHLTHPGIKYDKEMADQHQQQLLDVGRGQGRGE